MWEVFFGLIFLYFKLVVQLVALTALFAGLAFVVFVVGYMLIRTLRLDLLWKFLRRRFRENEDSNTGGYQ